MRRSTDTTHGGSMKIGVPTEVKNNENRVALTPAGADRLVHEGHRVLVQSGAGVGSGISDDAYRAAGAEIVDDRRRGLGRGRPADQGEGADRAGVRLPASRPHALHLPAPRRRPRPDHRAGRCGHHRRRLRDGAAARPQPAAARADERDRRPPLGDDGLVLADALGRRPRRAAGRHRRHPAREDRRDRRRRRRRARRGERARPGLARSP